jgi:hypothetical protein
MTRGEKCKEDSEHRPAAKCFVRSTNLMRVRAKEQGLDKEDKAIAMVLGGNPLGFPIPENFIADKPYELTRDEFVDPSLKCWVNILFGNTMENSGCLSTSYADKFLEMINRDICLRNSGITPASQQNFPIALPHHSIAVPSPMYEIGIQSKQCDPK